MLVRVKYSVEVDLLLRKMVAWDMRPTLNADPDKIEPASRAEMIAWHINNGTNGYDRLEASWHRALEAWESVMAVRAAKGPGRRARERLERLIPPMPLPEQLPRGHEEG